MPQTPGTQTRFAQFMALREAANQANAVEFRAENDFQFGKADEVELAKARLNAEQAKQALHEFLGGGE